MIKIPLNKYKNSKMDLVSEHFINIQNYIIDVVQFYINCCIIVEKMSKSSISENEYKKYNEKMIKLNDMKTLKSLMQVLSNEKFEEGTNKTGIRNIEDIFEKDKIKDEFKTYCDDIKKLLIEFLDSRSDIFIEKIIKGKPEFLIDTIYKKIINSYSYIQKSGKKIFNKNSIENSIFKDIFNKIFDYDKFSSNGINTYIEGDFNKKKWGAYDLCEKLNVNVCPYCNRSYTFTVRKIIDNNINPKREAINIIRPQLDHYFPQSKYPIFALSFYNLIPSCSICNSSIKGNKDLNLLDNLHPYLDSIDDYYTFDYNILSGSVFDGDKDGVEIIISKKMGYTDIKSENNINFFKIKEIYKQHNDVVSNLVYKRRKYTDSRLEEIEELFNLNRGSIISKEELFKDIFNELNEDEIIDTSLGKLNRDIVDKLKRIKN